MPGPGDSPSAAYRWVRVSQYTLNAVVLSVAIGLALVDRRRALFVAALVPIAFVPFSYARLRVHRAIERLLGAGPRARRAIVQLSAIAGFFDGLLLAQLFTARSQFGVLVLQAPGVTWTGTVWFSAYALFFLGLVILGGVRLLRRGGRRLLRAVRVNEVPLSAGPAMPERRLVLQQLAFLGVGTPFIVSLTGVELSYDFRVQEREIVLPQWPPGLDGLRVAHLSDIHVGGAMNRARLLHVAALTNAARPDVVLHTGDFLTHRSGDFDAPLYEALGRISAPYGQWASLGNHDFDNAPRLVRKLADAGVTTLRNELATLIIDGHAVEVAGLDFLFDRTDRPARYAELVDAWPQRGVPRLLLNHDPRAFAALPDGCADLVYAGHFHGGQIGMQLGPTYAVTVVGLAGIPDQGVFERDDMRLFVTRCVGFYGYPMRLGIPPEISLLILRAPSATARRA